MNTLTDCEAALLFCVTTYEDPDVLEYAPAGTRRHVQSALDRDDEVEVSRAAVDRLRATLPRDREAIQHLRAELPRHWRNALDRIAAGNARPADSWVAVLLEERLGDHLSRRAPEAPGLDLSDYIEERDSLQAFVRRLGLDAIGVVASGLDRRGLARLLRNFDSGERSRIRSAARRTVDTPLTKLVTDAFVRLADDRPSPPERVHDMGLFTLAFALADERNAHHVESICRTLPRRQSNRFRDFVSASRGSSRRDLADAVIALIAETEDTDD